MQCRPHIRDLVYAPTPDRAGPASRRQRDRASSAAAPVPTQADSQDSLPTPDPSSDGVEALMRRSDRTEREEPANDRGAKIPPTARGPQEKRSLDTVVAADDEPLKRQRTHGIAAVTSGPTEAAIDPAPAQETMEEAAAPPVKPGPASPPPPPKRPILRDSSVQTSPPPEEKTNRPTQGRDATKSASPIPDRDPTRSPSPERPEAHLSESIDSQAPQGVALRPSRVAEQDISLLMRGAAEQQQRLERDRRKSVIERLLPAQASDPAPAREEEDVAADDEPKLPVDPQPVRADAGADPVEPRVDTKDGDTVMGDAVHAIDGESARRATPPRQRALGPTSSAILMPPPATAGSRTSPTNPARNRKVSENPRQERRRAERSSEPPHAVSDSEASDPIQSGETSSSNTSAGSSQQVGGELTIRDSQEERPPRTKRKKVVPPTAAQHATISTHPILPLPGFTATTAANTDPDISYEAPAAAQGDDSQNSDRYRASTTPAAPFVLPAGSVPSEFELAPSTSSSTLSAGTTSHSRVPSRGVLHAPTSSIESSRAHSQKQPARARIGSVPALEHPRSESGGPQSRASSLPPDMQNGKFDREWSYGDLFSTLPESQVAAAMEEAERQFAERTARTAAAAGLASTTVALATTEVLAARAASQVSSDWSVSDFTRGIVDEVKLAREEMGQAASLHPNGRDAQELADHSIVNDDDEAGVVRGRDARKLGAAALGGLDVNELLPLTQVFEVDGGVSDSPQTDSGDENGALRRSNSLAGLTSEAEQMEEEGGGKEDEDMWAELLKTVIDDVES